MMSPNTFLTGKIFKPLLLSVLVGLLVACGDSDLEQLQTDEIRSTKTSKSLGSGGVPLSDPPVTETDKIKNSLEMVFSDEFDGAVVDDTKWNTQLKWGPDVSINNDMQYYVDEKSTPDLGFTPFLFDGNVLSITAQPTESNQSDSVKNKPYLSGVLSSHDKFEFTYGYTEVRAKLPAGSGYWPAFWMLSSQFVKQKPQLFVMESRGDNTASVYHRYNFTDADDKFQPSEFMRTDGTDFSADFHTFGVLWGPASIFFYVDGEKTHSIGGSDIPSQAMYMILNLAVGNEFSGAPTDETLYPGSFDIDYVRVYQAKAN